MYRYAELADTMADEIARGLWLPGTRFPSIRASASRFHVGINTVKSAYRLLEDRGLIIARPQSGYFVCEQAPVLSDSGFSSVAGEKISLSGVSRLLSIILSHQQQGDCIDLALACPSGEKYYPADKLRKLTAAVLRSESQLMTTYVLPPGSERLRQQIARRGYRLGMALKAEDILLTHGTTEALSLAIRAVTKPGDIIAVETPTFYNLYPAIWDLGREILEIETSTHTGLCLDTLQQYLEQKKVSAVITIPTGHNPLGFTMPVENRKRLAAMAAYHSVPVIEDAMYAELQYTSGMVPNIKAFDFDGWVLACASYTKTIAPDYRVGWLEAGRFRDIAMQLKFTSSVGESVLLTESLGKFLENGGYDHHLRKICQFYAAQIDRMRALIMRYFPKGTLVSRPQAGFVLWLELPASVDTLVLFHQALEEKIICMPGVLCSGGKRYQNCLRMAVCFDLTPAVVQGIARLGSLATQQIQSL
ncbi:PLP-dependent aminotransferase family protein [Enterobacter hormaechei]